MDLRETPNGLTGDKTGTYGRRNSVVRALKCPANKHLQRTRAAMTNTTVLRQQQNNNNTQDVDVVAFLPLHCFRRDG